MHMGNSLAREDEESLLPEPTSQQSGRVRWVLPSVRGTAASALAFMRPSFLNRRVPASEALSSEKPAAKKYASTEYLDGVRGVASLIVFVLHWSHIPYPSVNAGWGYKNNNSLWLLPFVRLVFSGAAMVAVFFVVSGFVLSHRYIQRMHQRPHQHQHQRAESEQQLYASLTSLTWRRAIRLFLPAFASSTMAFVCTCMGIVTVPRKVQGQPFQHSFHAYLEYLDAESNPWDWTAEFFGFYNPQLWSIAVEFRGSMIVFLLLLALARTRTAVRIAVETLVVVHAFAHRRWDVALFVAGMVIAELQVLFGHVQPAQRRRLTNVLLVATLVAGVFLSGYPREHNTKTPGYMWTAHVWPLTAYRRRFWLAISAILIVGPMAFLPSVQAIFMTRPIRYLGRISFALYLVHGLGNRTVGKWLLNGCWDYIGKEGFWPYTISFVVSTTLYFPFVIWVSDMFWRGVDIPSTNFARWAEKKCSMPEPSRS
jgi:peptidoglycan/LPS O-acetylase OafA/YrhL